MKEGASFKKSKVLIIPSSSSAAQEKDIYLLDDPLAAVDADVAKHLLEKCILGILKHKTRIICTHRIEFLRRVDAVVLMDNGTVVKIGTQFPVFYFHFLLKSRKSTFLLPPS